MSKTKTENRGGKRKGSGRKSLFALGHEERAQVIKDIDAEFKKNGTSRGVELGKMMNSSDQRLKMQAYQLFYRDVIPKVAERDVNITEFKMPQVFIPEKYPDSDDAADFNPRVAPTTPFKKKPKPIDFAPRFSSDR